MIPRTKNILLVTGFCLFLMLAYKVAFSKTIALKERINTLENNSQSLRNSLVVEKNLLQRERFMDSVLSLKNMKGNSVENNLLEILNSESESNQFIISDFTEPHTYSQNGATITSYRFTLKGSYTDIESVIYNLEQQYNFGRIIHVHLEKKTDYRKAKDYLEAFVIAESLLSH